MNTFFSNTLYIISTLLILINLLGCQPKEKPFLPSVTRYKVDTTAFSDLTSQLQKLSKEFSGTIGISIYVEETATRFELNSDEFFPLASVYKLPIVATLAKQAEMDQLQLEEILEVNNKDRRHSGCFMDDSTYQKTYKITLAQLAKWMLMYSDNCATDIVLKTLGGPKVVQQQLNDWEVKDLNIDRYLIELFVDLVGKHGALPQDPNQWSFDMATRIFQAASWNSRKQGRAQFLTNLQDQGTPNALVHFIRAFYAGAYLSPENTNWIKDNMYQCRTGAAMLPKVLPQGYHLAHKTGSLPGIFNDVGWLEKPGFDRPIFYAIFMKGSTARPSKDKELFARIMQTIINFQPLQKIQ